MRDAVEPLLVLRDGFDSHSPDAIVVDGDGLGAGVVAQLQHRGYSKGLFEFHGGERPRDFNMYFNRRDDSELEVD